MNQQSIEDQAFRQFDLEFLVQVLKARHEDGTYEDDDNKQGVEDALDEPNFEEIEALIDQCPPSGDEKVAAFSRLKEGLSQLDDHLGYDGMDVPHISRALCLVAEQMLLRLKHKYHI